MSALLPPPEPPADDVADLRELYAFARHQSSLAVTRLARARDYAGDPHADASERMHTMILMAVREFESQLWTAQLLDLADKLRARGVEL